MAYLGRDLDLHVVERIWDKYFKDKANPSFKVILLTEVKRVLFNISMNAMTLEEAREYLLNFLQAVFGDDLKDEEYEDIINNILRVAKIEEIRTRTIQRKRARLGTTF